NNYFRYFYLGSRRIDLYYTYDRSDLIMSITNSWSGIVGMDFGNDGLHIAMKPVVHAYEKLREVLADIPVINFFVYSAVYIWGLVILAAYLIRKRRTDLLVMIAPVLFTVLTYVVGPTNGDYARYIYVLIVALPLVFTCCLTEVKKGEGNESTQSV
nr:DUF6020 family protein [Lachnospiraceae bacterium]